MQASGPTMGISEMYAHAEVKRADLNTVRNGMNQAASKATNASM